jgi:hypothetical protein
MAYRCKKSQISAHTELSSLTDNTWSLADEDHRSAGVGQTSIYLLSLCV